MFELANQNGAESIEKVTHLKIDGVSRELLR